MLGGLAGIRFMMKNRCLALSNSSVAVEGKTDGEALLEVRAAHTHTHIFLHLKNTYSFLNSPCRVLKPGQKFFTATEAMLSPGHMDSIEDVSELLGTVENAIKFIGPQLKDSHTRIETTETGNSVCKLSRDLHI